MSDGPMPTKVYEDGFYDGYAGMPHDPGEVTPNWDYDYGYELGAAERKAEALERAS